MTEFHTGDRVKIKNNESGHDFKIGEEVTIISDLTNMCAGRVYVTCVAVDGREVGADEVYLTDMEHGVPLQDPLDAFIALLEEGELDELICHRWGGLGTRKRSALMKKTKVEWVGTIK